MYDENKDPFETIKNPLVRDYLRKKAEARKTMESDQEAQKLGDYAGVASNIASDIVNASKPKDVILNNSWQGMGSTPKVNNVADQRIDFMPAKNILDAEAGRSKAAYDQLDKDFDSTYKAGQADRTLQTQDPTSRASQSAQILARSALASKAKEAEAAGDAEGAARLRNMDISGMSAAEAKDFYDGARQIDYKDVLNNINADKRLSKQIAADKERGEKSDRDVTFKLSERYSGDATTKATAEVRSSAERAEQLARTPSATNDMGLVYSLMKSFDPGSTVRESEFAMAAKSGSLGDQLKAYVSLIESGQMTPAKRAEVLNTIREQANAQERRQAQVDGYYTDLANQYKASPDLVVGKKRSTAPVGQDSRATKPKTVIQNGHTYTLNPATGEYE